MMEAMWLKTGAADLPPEWRDFGTKGVFRASRFAIGGGHRHRDGVSSLARTGATYSPLTSVMSFRKAAPGGRRASFAFFSGRAGFLAVACCSAGTRSDARVAFLRERAMVCLGRAIFQAPSGSWWRTPGNKPRRVTRSNSRRTGPARGDHTDFLGDGLQSIIGGPAVAYGVRRMAGRRGFLVISVSRVVSAQAAGMRCLRQANHSRSGLVMALVASLLAK